MRMCPGKLFFARLIRSAFTAMLLSCLLPATVAASPESDASDKDHQRPKIGLVLSGGGARGFAHVGVLKIIEQLDIPIDIVVGLLFDLQIDNIRLQMIQSLQPQCSLFALI